jgi:hypothetical protein
MNEAIWDSETGHQLAYVKDRQDVFRAADHKQIGTYRDGPFTTRTESWSATSAASITIPAPGRCPKRSKPC